jgi:hypothetical protein
MGGVWDMERPFIDLSQQRGRGGLVQSGLDATYENGPRLRGGEGATRNLNARLRGGVERTVGKAHEIDGWFPPCENFSRPPASPWARRPGNGVGLPLSLRNSRS